MLLLFFLASLLFSLGLCYTGDPITKDGVATIVGYPGTVYQAVDYIPVCGTLGAVQTTPIEVTAVCDPAMSVFNTTSTTYAFYDDSGVLLSVRPVTGTPGCMCFSLAMLSGSQGDICISIDGYGQPQVDYVDQLLSYILAGNFQPGGKSLPQCKDVNISAISSSVYAQQPTSNNAPASNGGTPVATTGVLITSSPTAGPSTDGLTKSAEIGTIIGTVVGVIVLVLACVACARGH